MKSLVILLVSLAAGAAVLGLLLWTLPEREWVAGALAALTLVQTEEALIKATGRRAREHGPAGGVS